MGFSLFSLACLLVSFPFNSFLGSHIGETMGIASVVARRHNLTAESLTLDPLAFIVPSESCLCHF